MQELVQTVASGGVTTLNLSTTSVVRVHRSSDSAVTLQLPALSSLSEGQRITAYLTDAFKSTVNVAPNGSDLMGVNLATLDLIPYRAITFIVLLASPPTWGLLPVS